MNQSLLNKTELIKKLTYWLSFLWFLNAAYVSYLYFFVIKKAVVWFTICDINNTFSCTQALSLWINIFWVPPCTIAMVIYPILGYLAYKNTNNSRLTISLFAFGWILMNAWIIYKESFFWIYCLLCLICWVIITSLFAINLYAYLKNKNPTN